MTYTIINQKKLGSGSYGDVYVVKDEAGNKMAVKIIDPKKLSYVELDILTRLKSPYIIRSVGDPVVKIQHAHGITLELKDNCVAKLDTRKLPYYQLKKIMLCCLFGLRCMHSKGFIHNDLVLRNLLYDRDPSDGGFVAYLADFSVSIRCRDAHKGVQVTSIVRGTHTPIEIITGIKERKKSFIYNDKTDIWSLGLCFLEMIEGRRLHFSSDTEQLEYYNYIDQDFIKGKIRLYSKSTGSTTSKISRKEELYLTELLTNMLKLKQSDRMGSDDLMYLNFVKTSSIKYDCYLNKPSELMVIPAISRKLRNGLDMIRTYFKRNSSLRLSCYFLTVQIYTRIMSKIILDPAKTKSLDLKEVVDVSIKTAGNYYNRSVVAGYEGGILLRGEIGYNPYFNAGAYLEELKLVDAYMDEDGFMSMYNLINPYKLFFHFRNMYIYGEENKITNRISYERFMEISVPVRKDGDRIIYLPSDYSNVSSSHISEGESSIRKEKQVEQIFNGMLVDYLKREVKTKFNSDFPDIIQLARDYVEGGTRIRGRDVYKDIKNKDIFGTLMGINTFFEYGIVKIEDGNIVKNVYHDRRFVVVTNINKVSLIHVNPEQMIVTHYYSEPNAPIKAFYEENGYEYKMNFDYGVNSCCKVLESCVMFVIFYNNYVHPIQDKDYENSSSEGDLDFEMRCISEETSFVIFLSLFLQN
jgi:serine/threonine protein kinase